MAIRTKSTSPVECPSCGGTRITTTMETEHFAYGKAPDVVELSATIPVRHCEDCGFQFTDAEAEDAHHDAVCRHLGVLTPSEIVSVRALYQLSRADFAAVTRVGEASLQRWETGQLIQNPGYDQLLYLLRFPMNMERLRQRGAEPAVPAAQDTTSRFPNVIDIEQASAQASSFRLHARAS
jgi:putative zinc finger/helix-turn-helix YgiT family protein